MLSTAPTKQQEAQAIPGIDILGATAMGHDHGPQGIPVGPRYGGLDWASPAADSTGGKQKLGPISKQGDRYLRRILVVGAHAVLKLARQKPEKYPWLTQLLARKPFKVVAVACQQDGAHRLGIAGQGRRLWAACTGGSGLRGLAMGG